MASACLVIDFKASKLSLNPTLFHPAIGPTPKTSGIDSSIPHVYSKIQQIAAGSPAMGLRCRAFRPECSYAFTQLVFWFSANVMLTQFLLAHTP